MPYSINKEPSSARSVPDGSAVGLSPVPDGSAVATVPSASAASVPSASPEVLAAPVPEASASVPSPRHNPSHLKTLLTRHLTQGIPISDLDCGVRDQKRLSAIMRTFEAYNLNPFMSVRKWLTQRESRYISLEFLPIALELFEYLRTSYSEHNSRQRAFDQASYLAESAAKQALATGDAQMKLRASQQLTRLHGLDKPAPAEDVSKNTANLPWFLVRTPKAISEDAEEYTDFELEKKMRELGAAIDPHFIEVNRRVQEMERRSEQATLPSASPHPDYLTDDLFEEYD